MTSLDRDPHLRGPAMLDPEIIERARAIDMLSVTERHGLQLAKQAHEYVGSCPRCGGCSRFNVNPGKGVFLCRGCNAAGAGAIDLEIFVSECGFPAAIEALTAARLPSPDEARAAAAKRHAAEKATQAGQVETARWLWEQRRAPQGSIVERYLAGRGYTGMIPATLAYLPPRQSYPPAMIAAYALPIRA
jgi:CHC2 zinc finger